jgi:hypothetical protein
MLVILLFIGMLIVAGQNIGQIGYYPKLPLDKIEKAVYTVSVIK